MSMIKTTTIDEIKACVNGQIEVCEKVEILDDGEIITSNFHRHVIAPGDDYSKEDPRVQAICAVVQTPDVIEKYKQSQKDLTPVL